MILEIIIAIVLYFVVIPFIVDFLMSKIFKVSDALFVGLVSIVTSMAIFIAAQLSYTELGSYKLFDTRELVALQDNESLVVSRHSASSESYYHYVHKIGESHYAKRSKQSLSVVKYTKNDPSLKVFKIEPPNKFVDFLALGDPGTYKYEFYLPEGTIKEEYDIDLN